MPRAWTLYTFDKDGGGKSMCNGPCAENWPALQASDDAKPDGSMTIVVRDDGQENVGLQGQAALHLQEGRVRPATISMAMAS